VGVNAGDVTLGVNARGDALVGYAKRDGGRRTVLVSGAVNARAPSRDEPQAEFEVDYTGGRESRGRRVALRFRNGCRPYDGPALAYFVTGCTAPDGSYWALQSWQRLQAMRGVEPFRPRHTAVELHLSHWTGPLPDLEVSPNWTYGGRWQGLFGRLTYLGVPAHGYRTPSDRVRDGHARFVYIDTFNSVYGAGWKRDTGIATHVGNGAFCYSFVPQALPPGYPSREVRGPGNGERHRVTVMGPGVTPIVQWEGAGLGRYDAAADRAFNTLFDRVVGPGDDVCRAER
jgi:hypothetical protein